MKRTSGVLIREPSPIEMAPPNVAFGATPEMFVTRPGKAECVARIDRNLLRSVWRAFDMRVARIPRCAEFTILRRSRR
jgi:hypothetical protein